MKRPKRLTLLAALVVVTLGTTTGCAGFSENIPALQRGRMMGALAEESNQRTEIMQLYKQCLVRAAADSSVDCSQFATAYGLLARPPTDGELRLTEQPPDRLPSLSRPYGYQGL